MATRSGPSIVCEGLLLTILLLGLSFSFCNATSRSIGGADLPDGRAAAHACAGRESCQTRSALEQDVDTMHQSAGSAHSLSFVDSSAALAKNSLSRLSNHDDNSEWATNSEIQNMNMHHERVESSNLGEGHSSMTDSDRAKENFKWMSDTAHRHVREQQENMRDPSLNGMTDSERKTDSADTMSDIDKRIRNPQRLRDLQRTKEESQSKAEWLRVSDRSAMDVGNMRDLEGTMVSGMSMRDSHRMIASGRMRDTHSMIDSEGVGDTHIIRDSHMMANSDRMMDSDMLRDSQKMRTSQERSSQHLGEMLNSDQHRRDSDQMMNQGKLGESLENLRNSESWRRTHLGNAQDEQSEMMRELYNGRTSERRRQQENPSYANDLMGSAVAQMQNFHGDKSLQSEMTGEQTTDLHRKGDQPEKMRSANNMQGWEHTRANSHSIQNSNAARSLMGNMMEKQHSSTMETNFCQGTDCGSTSDLHREDSTAIDHERVPSSSRSSYAEINVGSQSENSEAAYSTAAEKCSGMNAADCDTAIAGDFQGSQRNRDLSLSSCRLGAADCRMREADNNPRSMETMQMGSCSNIDCHTSVADNQQPMAERQHRTRNAREIVSSPKWMTLARTTSTMNGVTRRIDNDKETLPIANQGMTKSTVAESMETSRDGHFGSIDAEWRNSNMRGSEMLQSTSNRRIRPTAQISGASSCTNGGDCRSTSGIMHMSKGKAEWMGRMHDQEIAGQTLCTNGADCTSTSEITHMSPRDSALMGQSYEKIINGQSACASGADCRSTSEIMHMKSRDSGIIHTGSNWNSRNGDLTMDQDTLDHSKMMHRESDHINAATEMNMINSNEAADNLHINRGN